ncbi:ATP-binding cassette domain-containing protein [Sulfoacidibacillus ferrooxidans]|uniref:Vitamin B12 import ATP-binding protein BtuD n=1 Tax=Sulfoacidibacillus ferrooxidans TaxID=2005001 RepID=A0A9X2AAT6_9BACL|nr:ATP-binding cassette domain-containing protein [Sulfoacidibacillus ferrooxidans]MCI0181959.1 Vitamin B12 import ATP-binding protein BtuD [Sulfoacidibacillus ferrooxidans]
MENESWLSLQHVSITYDQSDAPVVSTITFAMNDGESVLFLGPSGCGKSTVAMLCAGIIPQAVEAKVEGIVTRHSSLTEPGGIGYVFQDAEAQFCMLKVGDEIAFGLENMQVAVHNMTARIADGLQKASLDVSFAETHTTFSGGMKQKLAIASALAMDAKLLIFDEPTANLDPTSSRIVFEQIGVLHQQGKSMIVIEHKFDILLQYMDRVVLFDEHGQIHRVGETRQVIADEWEWLVQVGVVSAWKERPQFLMAHDAFYPHLVQESDHQIMPDATCPPVISIRDGSVCYGEQTIWSHLSLSIEKGSFTVIVGPNGAGKSTLLQVMRGLTKLTSGRVEVLMQEVRKWNKKQLAKAVSYCFQNPEYQFIYERVCDELSDRIVGEDVPEDILLLLDQFGLADHAQHSPFALSQGQKRRLSVAAMVKTEHEIYLLDEPTFGQDAKTQQAIMDRLLHLHKEGRTIVITTHDMDLVRRFATHVIVVAQGGLLFDGSPNELFANRECMREAHLLDDLDMDREKITTRQHVVMNHDPLHLERRNVRAWQKRTIGMTLNPAWLLLSTLCVTVVAIFAHTVEQGVALLALTIVLMMVIANLNPIQIAKRMSPFIGFYLLYVWSLTAFAAVGPHTPTFHFLFYRLSWTGFYEGVVLALRMLSAVGFGVLFLSAVDITDVIVALSKNFFVQPKFAYGILSGIRVVPLFQSEWTKLKQARQLRGKEARLSFMNPVTYALPLLSQAIRMSERVAIAMEARGFIGDVATNPHVRTYYRDLRVRYRDYAYFITLIGITIILLVIV